MQDTFLDAAHVKESFPGNEVTVQNGTELAEPQRPFKVTFAQPLAEAQPDSKVSRFTFSPAVQGYRYRP